MIVFVQDVLIITRGVLITASVEHGMYEGIVVGRRMEED